MQSGPGKLRPQPDQIQVAIEEEYVADDELARSDGSRPDPHLKDFIDRVIVPVLVRVYIAQSRELGEEQAKITQPGNLSSASSQAQAERRPSVLDEKRLLTVAEAAVALGIKVATVRAWVSKRKITFVKLGRLDRIPAGETKMLIRTRNYSFAYLTSFCHTPIRVSGSAACSRCGCVASELLKGAYTGRGLYTRRSERRRDYSTSLRFRGIALMSMCTGGASSAPWIGITGFPKRYEFASLNASKRICGSACFRNKFHSRSSRSSGSKRLSKFLMLSVALFAVLGLRPPAFL